MGSMALPVVIGAVCGLVGGLPYAFAALHARRKRDTSVIGGLVAVCASLVALLVAVVVARAVAQDVLLPFAAGMIVAFFVVVVAGVVIVGRRSRP